MSLVNFSSREVNIKIVYYGPGLSGKTTNLQHIHQKLKPVQRGKLLSLATETDRTLFFDFMPVNLGEVKGFRTKFHIYTVPGQVHYNETRKMVLKGVDGIVFVADAQKQMMNENIESLQNLEDNLREYGKALKDMPFVLQYNKMDLENLASIDELHRALNPMDRPALEAVALDGKGVLETFTQVCKFSLKQVREKPTLMNEGRAEEDELLTRLMEKKNEEERAVELPGEEAHVESARADLPPKAPHAEAAPEMPSDTPFETPQEGEIKGVETPSIPKDPFETHTELTAPVEEPQERSEPEGTRRGEDVEASGYGEEIEEAPFATPVEVEDDEDVELPEGIEMEPGFELGDEDLEEEAEVDEGPLQGGLTADFESEAPGPVEAEELEPAEKIDAVDVFDSPLESEAFETSPEEDISLSGMEDVPSELPEEPVVEEPFAEVEEEPDSYEASVVEEEELAGLPEEPVAEEPFEVVEEAAGFETEAAPEEEQFARTEASGAEELFGETEEEPVSYEALAAPEGEAPGLPEEYVTGALAPEVEEEVGGETFGAAEPLYSREMEKDAPSVDVVTELSVAGGREIISLGLPEKKGGGAFTIPIVIDTESGRREFNLNLAIDLEAAGGEDASGLLVESTMVAPEDRAVEEGPDEASEMTPVEEAETPSLEASPDDSAELFSISEAENSVSIEPEIEESLDAEPPEAVAEPADGAVPREPEDGFPGEMEAMPESLVEDDISEELEEAAPADEVEGKVGFLGKLFGKGHKPKH